MLTHGYEHRRRPLLPRGRFLLRLLWTALVAAAVMLGSLLIGVVGFRYFDDLSWLDSLVAASMLLSGEGPVCAPRTGAAKLFASVYALFSGVVFLTVSAMLVAPVLHRMLHRFHVELDERK